MTEIALVHHTVDLPHIILEPPRLAHAADTTADTAVEVERLVIIRAVSGETVRTHETADRRNIGAVGPERHEDTQAGEVAERGSAPLVHDTVDGFFVRRDELVLGTVHVPDDIAGDFPGLWLATFVEGPERLFHQGVDTAPDNLVGQVLGVLVTSVGKIVFDKEHLAGALVDHTVIVHLRLFGYVRDGKLQILDHLFDDGFTRGGLIIQFRRGDDMGHKGDVAELENHVIVAEGSVEIGTPLIGIAECL